MEIKYLTDDEAENQLSPKEISSALLLVLSAEARHKAMEERALARPMFKDISNFVKDLDTL